MIININTRYENEDNILLTIAESVNGRFYIVSANKVIFTFNDERYVITLHDLKQIIERHYSIDNFLESFLNNVNIEIDFEYLLQNNESIPYFKTKEDAEQALQWIDSFLIANKLTGG